MEGQVPLTVPQGPNQRWSLDFVSDTLTDSRRFCILAVMDDFTRECIALIADTSLSGARVGRELAAVIDRPRPPGDDCQRQRDRAHILRWSQLTRIEWHYIAPGKAESIRGKL